MKVLLTGAEGQLGCDLADAFAGADLIAMARSDLDVADEAAVADAVGRIRPHLVVNAAAWTDVDGCESDPERAHRVNALGPWWLARACHEVGASLVTYSTDYVFDGNAPRTPQGQRRAWSEFDPVSPINEYGRSKAAGEQLVRESLRQHFVIRTAWVCGARGSNFVRAMLRIAEERGEASVVDDQHGSPTFTRDLASATGELVETRRYGTYHLTNSGWCSWYDLAAATFEFAGLDVALTRMSSSELQRPAPRPSWSVLSAQHSTSSGLSPLRPWQDGLRSLLNELGYGTTR